MPNARPLIAVDIGNSRIKFGLFESLGKDDPLPKPQSELSLPTDEWQPAAISEWLPKRETQPRWYIASVNGPATSRLLAWLAAADACELTHRDLPLKIRVEAPEHVGIDRLLGAVAANRLRDQRRPAIVIDLGSALTVDLVDAGGAFLGGAILPGIGMSARAMSDFTDRLPLIEMDELADPPPALGTSTVPAMRSGLYWGAVGAMKELIARLSGTLPAQSEPAEIFLTGGAAPIVARFLDSNATCIPHLILGAIAVVARTRTSRASR
jgi:type III pantothenate kinase